MKIVKIKTFLYATYFISFELLPWHNIRAINLPQAKYC